MPIHNIPPVFDENSLILILGSFPSVKSRESEFFYGHPQNRFWRVLANILNYETPTSVEQKRAMLLKNHIAVWDVIASCDINGSDDASISNVTENDLSAILNTAGIRKIFTNGKKAALLYKKYIYPKTKIEAVSLPSTSPANAAFSLERLSDEWAEKISPYF